jgi:hypothetical protein
MTRSQYLQMARQELRAARGSLSLLMKAKKHGAEEEDARESLVGSLAYASMFRAVAQGHPIEKKVAFQRARRTAENLEHASKHTSTRGRR